MKKYLAATLAAVLMTGSITVMAGTVKQTIEAYYSIKSLVVNGNDTGKGSTAFISNGTTYVPLRTVSDAIGADISFDKNTKTVFIETNNTSNNAGMPQDLPAVSQPLVTHPAPATRPTTPVQRPVVQQTNPNKVVKISQEQAKNIGLKRTGGGTVLFIKLDIDYDDDYDDYYDQPDYEMKIQKGRYIYEVEVNAITGAITDFDLDD